MSKTPASLSTGIRLDAARERIDAFSEFGLPHLYFAQHAAFPMSLTVDLLYRLWANFQRDIQGKQLHIPWIAVSDLLLSSLCDEVGHELYEMDVTVRAELLRGLQADPGFGQPRIRELSYFLLDYVQQQIHSGKAGVRTFAEAQQWMVLAYIQPGRVARELAESLKALEQNNKVEQIRLVSLMETLNTLAPPLSAQQGFTPLLTYARGVERVARGDIEGAKAQFSEVKAVEQIERAVGVRLPGYEGLLEAHQEVVTPQQAPETPATPDTPTTRKDFLISYHSADSDWANWIAWQLEEAGYGIELQTWNFQPEADFTAEVDRVEQLANHLIVILSPDYVSALASMPAWVDAFLRGPRNGPDFIVAFHVRECRAMLPVNLGSVDYTDVVGLDEETARKALLNRISRLHDTPSLPPGVMYHSLTVQPVFPGTPIVVTKLDKGVEVFIAYAREDRRMREGLDQHLAALQRQGLIATWHDRVITPAAEREHEIDAHLNSAQVILLLISADFLASDYAYGMEMKRVMERYEAGEAQVIPVLLREYDWQSTPFSKLQPLPRDGKPIKDITNDEAFAAIARELRTLVEQRRKSVSPVPSPVATLQDSVIRIPPSTSSRTIEQRETLVQNVYERLSQPDINAIVLTGIGGQGKSTLAALVHAHAEKQRKVGNGPFQAEAIWLRLDQRTTTLDLATSLFDALGQLMPDFAHLSPSNQAIALYNALNASDKPRLIVIDQFEYLLDEQSGQARANDPAIGDWLDLLNAHPCQSRLLLTSRPIPRGSRDDSPDYIQPYPVAALQTTEGAALLRKGGVEPAQASEAELREAVTLCSGHALSLTLLASILRHDRGLSLKTLFSNFLYAHLWPEQIATNLLDYIYTRQLTDPQRSLEVGDVTEGEVEDEEIGDKNIASEDTIEKHLPWYERLKRERELRFWTQADIANKIDCDPKTVARWELGGSLPNSHYRQRLSELYGKSLEELGFIEEIDLEKVKEQRKEEGNIYTSTGGFQNVSTGPFRVPATVRRLSFREESQIVEGLLGCSSIADNDSRQIVLQRLPSHISRSIRRYSMNRQDVLNIVEVCCQYSRGLRQLIEIVAFFEGDSQPIRQLKQLLQFIFFTPDPPIISQELFGELLEIITEVHVGRSDLISIYRDCVPAGWSFPELGSRDEDDMLALMIRRLSETVPQEAGEWPLLKFVGLLSKHTEQSIRERLTQWRAKAAQAVRH